MGDGGDIPDQLDLKTGRLQGPQGRFPARPRPFNKNVHRAHPIFHCFFGSLLGGQLGGKGGALSRAFKPLSSGTGPGDHISNRVRNRNDRIIKGGLNMDNPDGDIFLFFSFLNGLFYLFGHGSPRKLFFLLASQRSTRAFAGSSIGMGSLSAGWKGFSVPKPPVSTQIHQPLYAHGNFSPQISFHPAGTVHHLSNLGYLDFRQLIGLEVQWDLGFPQYLF